MFCPKCGSEIGEKAAVCLKCGVPVAGGKGASASSASVPNHMVGAILSTVFCCLIGGIVSIVYASMVNTKLAMGDIEGAKAASRTAKGWIIANVVIALVSGLIWLLSMGVLSSSISSAKQSLDADAVAAYGRNLFIGITQSCVERECTGLPNAWPHTVASRDLSDDRNDIGGIAFRCSSDYFKTLFDVASCGKDDWSPYAEVDFSVLKLAKDNEFCDWIVAANVQDEFPDVIPVLVSANVDPSVLKTSFAGKDDARIPFGSEVGRTRLPWCDDFVVVVRKGGAAEVFKNGQFTYSALYGNQSFSAPGLEYLDAE